MTEENQNQTIESTQSSKNTYDEDMKKYTKVDNLDEDSFAGFYLVSFISPEGIMNCNVRGLKLRTYKNKVVFQTLEEAQQAAEEINKKDGYFHVFVGESGKWMGWDPSPDDRTKVEKEVWANKDQNEIMQGLREKEDKKLQELNALVGKKKSMVDKDKKTHKKRVAKAIKDGLQGKQTQETQQTDEVESKIVTELPEGAEVVTEEEVKEEVKKVVNKKNRPNVNDIKNRLRKKLEDKQQKEAETKMTEQRLTKATQEVEASGDMKEKLDSNINKLKDILQKSKTASS
jgi:hypothetical protein